MLKHYARMMPDNTNLTLHELEKVDCVLEIWKFLKGFIFVKLCEGEVSQN